MTTAPFCIPILPKKTGEDQGWVSDIVNENSDERYFNEIEENGEKGGASWSRPEKRYKEMRIVALNLLHLKRLA